MDDKRSTFADNAVGTNRLWLLNMKNHSIYVTFLRRGVSPPLFSNRSEVLFAVNSDDLFIRSLGMNGLKGFQKREHAKQIRQTVGTISY